MLENHLCANSLKISKWVNGRVQVNSESTNFAKFTELCIFSCNFTNFRMLFQAVVTRPSNVTLGSQQWLSSSECIIRSSNTTLRE